MGTMRERLDLLILREQMKWRMRWQDFLEKEDGDTNFISIAIVLVIVIAVALVFFTFKERLMTTVTNAIENFFKNFKYEPVKKAG